MSARRLAAGLAVGGILLAACGTRVDREAAERAQAVQSGDPVPSVDVPPADSGEITFGDLPSPCGPGDASTATDQGVDEDSIAIGTIADPGGPIQGMNQGIHDSMEAFVNWCNSQGGINGRELELTLLDAAVLRYQEVVVEACDFAFALVGGGGALDYLGAQDAVDCGLVDVPAFTVSAEKADAERMVQPVPNPTYEYNVGAGRWILEQYPDHALRAASVYADVPVGEYQQKRHQEAYERIGYEFVYDASTNVGETNYGPTVVAMRDRGVRYFTFTSTYEELVNLQQAMRQQGMPPPCGAVEQGEDCVVIDLEANFYNRDYPVVGGEAVEGSFVRMTVWPFEESDLHPATRQYLDIMEEHGPQNAKIELLGVQAFSAGLLFATAAQRAGDDLTRERLLAELGDIHNWDGGGLHGPNDPGANRAGNCFIVMVVRDGGFERMHPEEGFACPDDGRVELEGDYGHGARSS